MWYECAPSSKIVNGQMIQAVPPTTDELTVWFNQYAEDPQLRDQVWHRFVLTKRNYRSMKNWAAAQFFFRNATKSQLATFDR